MNKKEFPKPQAYLTNVGKEIYYELCEHLYENSGFKRIDTFALSMLAQALEDFAEATKNVNEHGKVQVFKNGAQNVSAWYTVQRDDRPRCCGYRRNTGSACLTGAPSASYRRTPGRRLLNRMHLI